VSPAFVDENAFHDVLLAYNDFFDLGAYKVKLLGSEWRCCIGTHYCTHLADRPQRLGLE
jgi:hypothetical protein